MRNVLKRWPWLFVCPELEVIIDHTNFTVMIYIKSGNISLCKSCLIFIGFEAWLRHEKNRNLEDYCQKREKIWNLKHPVASPGSTKSHWQGRSSTTLLLSVANVTFPKRPLLYSALQCSPVSWTNEPTIFLIKKLLLTLFWHIYTQFDPSKLFINAELYSLYFFISQGNDIKLIR